MTPAEPGALSLDDELLWPILDRVARGPITVRPDSTVGRGITTATAIARSPATCWTS
jgi:hypothetical protein